MASLKNIVLLFFAFFIYSLSSIFSKLTSLQKPGSLLYCFFLGTSVAVLVFYAALWQKVLKIMPLTKAFLCKSLTLIIGLMIAYFVFAESITLHNFIGVAFIILGLIVLSWK